MQGVLIKVIKYDFYRNWSRRIDANSATIFKFSHCDRHGDNKLRRSLIFISSWKPGVSSGLCHLGSQLVKQHSIFQPFGLYANYCFSPNTFNKHSPIIEGIDLDPPLFVVSIVLQKFDLALLRLCKMHVKKLCLFTNVEQVDFVNDNLVP